MFEIEVYGSAGGGGTPNEAPTVSLTAPANNTSFSAGQTITISANAADSDGSLSKVEFYRGSTKLGEDNSSPYSYNWTGAAQGSYAISAKATDNDGASTTSSTRNITVTAPSQTVEVLFNENFDSGLPTGWLLPQAGQAQKWNLQDEGNGVGGSQCLASQTHVQYRFYSF